jgi:hypothetical protein
MYTFNVDDQVLAKYDTTAFATNSVNAPKLYFSLGDNWIDGITIVRFTDSSYTKKYDVVMEKTGDLGYVRCPAEVMTDSRFYIACKNTLDDEVLTTNEIVINAEKNNFNESGLTPSQTQSLEEQLLAKMNQINNIKTGLKKCLLVFKQTIYKDDADFTVLEEFENYIDNL